MKKKRILMACAASLALLATGCAEEIEQEPATLETTPVVETDAAVEETPTEPKTEAPTEPPIPEMTDRAKELYGQNKDTIGWITIPGTNVDNVIVQKKDEPEDEKNTYYLDKDFSHQQFRAGTVFMDYRDVFSYKEEDFSENLVLYGHNMADNTMFGSLRRYRQDLSFWKEAPFVHLSSNYQDYTYVIFGLVITSGDADNAGDMYADPMTWTGFPYWNMEELDDDIHYNYYINTIQSMNMVENLIAVEEGDQLLTLSTCYSDEDNSRFIVVARQLREDETEESLRAVINGEAPAQTKKADAASTAETTAEQ